MVGGSDGWQQLMGPVGGSGWWLDKERAKIPKKKQQAFFCFPIFGGWVGVSDLNMDESIFLKKFLNPSLSNS